MRISRERIRNKQTKCQYHGPAIHPDQESQISQGTILPTGSDTSTSDSAELISRFKQYLSSPAATPVIVR